MTNVTLSTQWSKMLFNNAHMLRVAAEIHAGGEQIDARTLQRRIPLGQSAVHRVLRTLEGVELLTRQERTSRTDVLQYTRADHPFWASAATLFFAAERTG